MSDAHHVESKCRAKQYGDTTKCAVCDLAWDTNDGDRPPCDPITFGRMMTIANQEAESIEDWQSRLLTLNGGTRSRDAMRRAAVFRRIGVLIDRVMANHKIQELLKAGNPKQ